MSSTSKYVSSFRLAQEISNSIKNLDQSSYNDKISKLVQLKNCIDNHENFEIVSQQTSDSTSSIDQHSTVFEKNSCSQHSVSSVCSSSSFFANNPNMNLVNAPKIGAPKKAHVTVNHMKGHLSQYASTEQNQPSANSTTTKSSINEQRSEIFLMDILCVKSHVTKVISKQSQIDDNDLQACLDGSVISNESFFLFKQYLNKSAQFKSYFTTAAFAYLNQHFTKLKMEIKCPQCSIQIKDETSFKICHQCYQVFHFKCSDKSKSTKLWSCSKCSPSPVSSNDEYN